MESCTKHSHEHGANVCGRCGYSWCDACLVFARGPKKAPYCMDCAMFAGGVRTVAARPAMPKRELKARLKAAAAEIAARPERFEVELPDLIGADLAAPAEAPASSNGQDTDWSSSWWETSPANELSTVD